MSEKNFEEKRLDFSFDEQRYVEAMIIQEERKKQKKFNPNVETKPIKPTRQDTHLIDKNEGEIVKTVIRYKINENGSGFVISYTDKICELIAQVQTGSYLRVFFYLAHHQQYGKNGEFGFRCTHQYLQKALSLDRKTIYRALKFLSDNFLVHEKSVYGTSEFMVNPNYITIGTSKKDRLREWSIRWKEYFKAKKSNYLV